MTQVQQQCLPTQATSQPPKLFGVPLRGLTETCGKPLVSQPTLLQAKLAIGQPNDRYEQEADQVADLVMRMPDPTLQPQVEPEEEEEEALQPKPLVGQMAPLIQRQVEPEEGEEEMLQTKPFATRIKPLVQRQAEVSEEEEEELLQPQPVFGRTTPLVQRQVEPEEEEEEEETIQTKQAGGQAPQAGLASAMAAEAQVHSLTAGGRPLPRAVRNFFEPRFGYDFSDVRLHLGTRAAQLAQPINARAFTLGRDIMFGARQYSPGSLPGRRLLAHELTHVIQQRIPGSLLRRRAWIQATTDPAAHSLSAALPEPERQRIRVITSEIDIADLHDLFSTEVARTTVPLPDRVTVNYAGAIPDELRHGLSNVAGRLVQNNILPLNSTVTLALNLEAYGGDFSAYRFTFVEHTPDEGETSREVLIERLGAVGVEGLTDPQRQAQEARFRQHGFTRGSGWSDDEFGVLLQAIAQISDSLLTPVDGLTFNRAEVHSTDPDSGGSYDPDTHTVTMYDRAFAASMTRFGTPGAGGVSTNAVRSVVHEIGHAVDLRPLREAWTSFEQAQETLRLAFQQYEDPPGSGQYSFPNTEQARWDALQGQVTQAEQALAQARSASGYRWQQQAGVWEIAEGGTGPGSNAFRRAAQQDGGIRITQYSDTEWQEYFAEAFSLYMTNPTVLQQLRPNVYDYFVSNHPQ